MNEGDGHAMGRGEVSRRRMIKLAGAGAGLALLGAGTAACGPVEEPAEGGGSGSPKPGESAKPGGDAPAPGGKPKPAWQHTTTYDGLAWISAVAVVDNVVLVSGDPLVARDLTTGKEIWSRAEVTTPGASMLLGDGTLYLASAHYDGNIIGLDPKTGKDTWRSRLGDKEYAQPRVIAADADHVYVVAGILDKDFRTPDNVIAAIDTSSGKVVWREQRDHGTEANGLTARVSGRRLVYTDFRENLTVRDTATGHQVWTKKIGRSSNRGFEVHEGLVIIATGEQLRAFDLETGAERWSFATEKYSRFNDPAVLDGVLYASDTVHGLWAADPATGKRHWHNPESLDIDAPWQFAKVGGVLYGATTFDKNGGIHAFDPADGKLLWTYNDGSGDIDRWYLAAGAKHVVAVHAKKVTALPVA
ncbi:MULTISPECIES: PQQ-binding-like beta-propeller repeat protein [unclassified Streptomyces]|uniref:PQQ-binding-like beta-propeller repeat protein n=1 Tax=unclassified Streptomyces TaxID=2593676 RepID=UPI002E824629|nr:PQQ-binding-like beta-propeller repeat protein [Streptomyces sp. NBC_00523]WUD00822.1 PQQ-binding-like beta-propeller repeat protein [Streptomyces sp. NBC_00523]